MEIPVLRRPERSKQSRLGLAILAAFCLGLVGAWIASRSRTRGGSGRVGSLEASLPPPEHAARTDAPGGAGVGGSSPGPQGAAGQAGERDQSETESSAASSPERASAEEAAAGALRSGADSALQASQGTGGASAGGGGAGSGAGPSRDGAANGTSVKVPLKWDSPGLVGLPSGEEPTGAGLPGSSSKARASAKKSKGASDEAALLGYLSGLRAQAQQVTKEQLRALQKALAAEEGQLERAMAKAPAYKPPPPSVPLARGKVWPVKGGGRVSQEFGPSNWDVYGGRTYNGKYYPHFHTGIDIAAPKGTPLVAFDAGRVIKAGGNQQSGVNVIVQHPDGSCTTYHHMGLGAAGPTVRVGQYVSAGQVLGYIGMTGMTTGPHVHFMVRYNDLVNPRQVLPSK